MDGIRAYIDYQFKPLNKETCVKSVDIGKQAETQ